MLCSTCSWQPALFLCAVTSLTWMVRPMSADSGSIFRTHTAHESSVLSLFYISTGRQSPVKHIHLLARKVTCLLTWMWLFHVDSNEKVTHLSLSLLLVNRQSMPLVHSLSHVFILAAGYCSAFSLWKNRVQPVTVCVSVFLNVCSACVCEH